MKLRSGFASLLMVFALMMGVSASLVQAQRVQFSAPVMVVNTSFLNIRTGPGVQYDILITVVGGTTLPVLGVANDRVWYQVSTVAGVGWLNSQFVLARGDFSNVPLVAAPPLPPVSSVTSFSGAINRTDDTAVDLGFSSQREWGVSVVIGHPLRSEPTINATEVQFLPDDRSIIFTITGATTSEGIAWVRIVTPEGRSGWLEQTKVTYRPFACELSAVLMTQDFPLNVGPDGTGGNGFVAGGQEAYLLDRVGDLYKIELIDGSVGWVEGSALLVRDRASVRSQYCEAGGAAARAAGVTAPTTPRRSPVVAIINTGFLNIRSGPGAQFTAVTALPGGTQLDVIGLAPDRVWYLVEGTFGRGWVNSEFVLFRGDGRNLPIIRGAVGEIATPRATVNQAVTLYAAPNLTLGVVGTLAAGSQVTVVARTADFNWVQLNTPLGFGWVQRDFVTLSGDTSLIPVVGG